MFTLSCRCFLLRAIKLENSEKNFRHYICKAGTIFVVACCTIISINIKKYNKVNCTLNGVFLIHDVSRKIQSKVQLTIDSKYN